MTETLIKFTVAPVASKKNGRRWLQRGGRQFLVPSTRAVSDEASIRAMAREAMKRAGLGCLPSDATIGIEIEHDVEADLVHVRVARIGSLPPGRERKGTKRDVHGMVETIADALSGVVYPDDRQVDRVTVERVRKS